MNKVFLIGRVGQDPEARTTTGGASVTKFTVATSEKFKTKDGEKREITEWHTVRCWRHTADFAGNYIKKGMLVSVEGKIHTETWTDKDGNDRRSTLVEADEVQIILRKLEEDPGDGGQRRPRQERRAPQQPEDLDLEPKSDDLPF